jgi:hypothetical protein
MHDRDSFSLFIFPNKQLAFAVQSLMKVNKKYLSKMFFDFLKKNCPARIKSIQGDF